MCGSPLDMLALYRLRSRLLNCRAALSPWLFNIVLRLVQARRRPLRRPINDIRTWPIHPLRSRGRVDSPGLVYLGWSAGRRTWNAWLHLGATVVIIMRGLIAASLHSRRERSSINYRRLRARRDGPLGRMRHHR